MDARSIYYKIKKKYNLDKGIEELLFVRKYMDMWNEKTTNTKTPLIALYGGGYHTKILLKLLTILKQDYKIAYIIDNYIEENQIKGIPVIREMDIEKYSVELIWISAWNSRQQISESLKINYPNVKYIEPYEELEKQGNYKIEKDVTTYALENKYKWFSEKIKQRRLSKNQEEKHLITKQLISGYYEICDWINFEKEIEEIINIEEKEVYRELLQETKNYLDGIKKIINERKQKSYIIYLVDSLSKFIVDDMEYLSKWKKNSLEFVEYRNEDPSTKETVVSYFTGWRPFENETYKRIKIEFGDSKLLSYIHNNNIKLKLLTSYETLMKNYENINEYNNIFYENTVISEIIFNGICELVRDESEQIIMIHINNTIHPTHRTPETEFIEYESTKDKRSSHKKNFENAVCYTDRILEYYLNLFNENENITEIVMGDHGLDIDLEYCISVEPQPYKNRAAQWIPTIISPALMIKGNGICNGIISNLVSTNQFMDILYGLIKKQNPLYYIRFQNIVPIEYVPGYNLEWINCGVKSHNYYLALGAYGCMNKEYIYLNLEDGNELYYKMDGKDLTCIESDNEKKKAIDILGKNIIELYKFPKKMLDDPIFELHNTIYGNNLIEW